MTNEQAIRALVETARQWVDLECRSQFGSGYRNAMRDVLNTLGHCPTGAAAILWEADPVEGRKKARRTGKAGQIGGKRTSAQKQASDQK